MNGNAVRTLILVVFAGTGFASSDALETNRRTPSSDPFPSGIIVRARPGVTRGEISDIVRNVCADVVENVKPLLPHLEPTDGEPHTRIEIARRRLLGLHRVSLVSAEGIEAIVSDLNRRPEIIYAEPDHVVTLQNVPDDPFFASTGSWGQTYDDLWGLHAIDAESAWNLSTGDPELVIAVIDSGLDLEHPDLQGNIWINEGEIPENGIDDDENGFIDDVNGWNFSDDTNELDDDHLHGHGTHVAGTIAAVGNNSFGVVGVMWRASIMPLKGFGASGPTASSDVAAAIVYAADNGARLTNNSWGKRGPPSQLVRDAFAYARAAGVTSVVAAGNDGIDVGSEEICYFSPACLEDVLTVAASNQLDERATFSNWGGRVSVVAPGGGTQDDPGVSVEPVLNILSLRAGRSGEDNLVVGESFYRLAGTSMAAPHVTGVAGLILSRQPGLVPELVQIIVEESADDLGAPGPDPGTGFGRVNAFEALLTTDAAATLPEFAVSGMRLDRTRAAPGSPVPVEIVLRNLGIAADDVAVTVHDETGSGPGTPLRQWSVDLDNDEAVVLETLISLDGFGRRSIVATIDPEDRIEEVTERNNHARVDLVLSDYYFSESALTEDPGDQVNPSISSRYVAYEDHGDDSKVLLYDISLRQVHVLEDGRQDHGSPALWENRIAWSGCDGDSCRVVLLDLGEDGKYGTADDVGPVDISGVVEEVTSIAGWKNHVAWADGRFGNQDVFVHDLVTSSERRITLNPRADISPGIARGWLFWEQWRYSPISPRGMPNILAQRLESGERLEIAVSDLFHGHPSVSDTLLVWEDWRSDDADILVYDLESSEQRPLVVAEANQRRPVVSGGEIVWEDDRNANWDVYYMNVDFGREELRLSHDPASQLDPAVADGKIVWQDDRNGNWDIWLATREPFPVPPTDLRVVRSAGRAALSWQSGEGENTVAYGVYRRTSGVDFFERVATTPTKRFEDDVDPGTDYHYRVTAIDRFGAESAYSEEVSTAKGH
jgi:beta propeller repeat protein